MNQERLTKSIKQGKIFIYPTDTLYGLGCDSLNKSSVERIKEIKGRDNKPFSVIAPSLEWIYKNLESDKELINKYLPGPYTFILKKKDKDFLNWVSATDTLGVRIPNHKFTKQIQEAGAPFITTSVNLSGNPPAIKFEDISEEILKQVDVIIKGEVSGVPSTLIINNKEVKR